MNCAFYVVYGQSITRAHVKAGQYDSFPFLQIPLHLSRKEKDDPSPARVRGNYLAMMPKLVVFTRWNLSWPWYSIATPTWKGYVVKYNYVN